MWDATCLDNLAKSHTTIAVQQASAVALDAEHRKRLKYSHLDGSHHFVPVAVETLRAFGKEARAFLRDVGHRTMLVNRNPLAHQYLVQRVAVAVQRGNAAAVLGCIGGSNLA